MEIKSRNFTTPINGSVVASTGTTTFATQEVTESQRTLSHNTGWPLVQAALRSPIIKGTGAEWVFTHRDWGASFITQRSTLNSSLWHLTALRTQKGTALPFYEVNQVGPCFLADHSMIGFYTDLELSNAEQALFMKGAEAVRIARPNKPQIDLSVTIGEIRKEGIPALIGSMAGRSRTVLDLFRSGGKEYLNLQFGWIPLLRDLTSLVQLVPKVRTVLEQYERDIDRLVRRRFHFPAQTTVDTTLAFTASHAAYRRATGTPWGYPPEDHLTFRPSGQVPEQVNQTIENTWFSGGFRFYHRSVPEALRELSLFEEKANLLLGTRLDPEVLWNLAPWTWLSDWFINFGDAIGNASALLSDDLVMQYGYLMRTTQQVQTTTWPEGLWYRSPTGAVSSVWKKAPGGAYSQSVSRVTKQRGKANPFGFGFTDADLSENQLAILAALGMSRK